MLSPVSTWMGDRLGTLGAVGIIFFIFPNFTLVIIFSSLMLALIISMRYYLFQSIYYPKSNVERDRIITNVMHVLK